jgi:hypothetical protein
MVFMKLLSRKASWLAAVAIAAASFTLVAPAAHASTPPAGDTNVFGKVVDANGVAQPNIHVEIYDVEADGSFDQLGVAHTDAAGEYWFDFTTGLSNDGNSVDASNRPQVKLAYFDERTLTGDQLELHSEYYNNQPTLKRGDLLTLGAANTTTTVPTVSLSYQSGIKGTVSVPVPAGYYFYGSATAYNADDNYEDEGYFDSDPTTVGKDNELTYLIDGVDPDQSYSVYFSATAYPISGPGAPINYVGHFYQSGSNFSDATPVVVGASNTITQPINGALSDVLTAAESPSIVGQVAPGKTLSVDPGTWSIKADTTYSYQWLLNDVQVSTAPTYKVAKSDLKKKLRVIVTARNYDFLGSASTESVKVGYASKLKVKASKAQVHGKTVVQVTGKVVVKGLKKGKLAKALKGKIAVYEGDVKVGKGKVLPGGKILVVLHGITAGKHELTVEFDGKLAADATSVEKIKV